MPAIETERAFAAYGNRARVVPPRDSLRSGLPAPRRVDADARQPAREASRAERVVDRENRQAECRAGRDDPDLRRVQSAWTEIERI